MRLRGRECGVHLLTQAEGRMGVREVMKKSLDGFVFAEYVEVDIAILQIPIGGSQMSVNPMHPDT